MIMPEEQDKSINVEETESDLEEVLRLLFEMDKPERDAYIEEFIAEIDAGLEEQKEEVGAESEST